jgi:tRNA uridine 5-carboxymethylaminomethyl modification enzyme
MFSFNASPPWLPQIACYLTRTTSATHGLVRDNLDQAPMYAGAIKASGARYCPSLEDKVVRFAERPSHQVFLEPQGLDNPWVYPNGISTSLPLPIQEKLVRTLPGCENAVIARPGYAIAYDMSDPLELTPGLESQILSGLFLAGQVNGSSGYEEAAAQGLVAGINAALKAKGDNPLTLARSQSYIGVLVDDLVTKGTEEPYRMFTSRSEYRLSLREDNADLRLTPLGRELGLVTDDVWRDFSAKRQSIDSAWGRLQQIRLTPSRQLNASLQACGQAPLRATVSAAELLGRLGSQQLSVLDEGLAFMAELALVVKEQLEIKAHYAGYLLREEEQVQLARRREATLIPFDMDFDNCPGLSREVCEKLKRVRPLNLEQAGRISGVTPAALGVLGIYLHKYQKMQSLP